MFEIEKVDMEHIDRISPLWEKLIQANAANSPYFADYYGTFEFEIRKGFLQEKLDNGAAMYTAVLVDREKKLDQLRWDWMEEATFFDYFTVERLFVFLLQLEMIERWISLDKEKGNQLFRSIIAALKDEVQIPAEFR